MQKALWIKAHPRSACHVGEVEQMSDERFEQLKEGGFVRPLSKEEENALNKEKTEKATGK